jgi:Polysaccharide pyruvyl transferase
MNRVAYTAKRIHDMARYSCAQPDSLHYCGWIGYGNLGDEAMFSATRRTFGPMRVAGLKLPNRPAWLKRYFQRKKHCAALLGGGTMIVRPSDGGPRFFPNFRDALARHGRGIVFGTGVHSRNPAHDLPEWKPLLEKCDFIGVRGPKSAELLQAIDVNAEVIGDPAASLVQPEGFWQPKDRIMGLNLGSLLMGETHPEQDDYNERMSCLIREYRNNGWSMEFFCVYPGDLDTIRRITHKGGLTDPIIHNHYWDAQRFMRAVRSMTVFVSTKLHAAILSLCAGVPTLAVNYQPKCEDFMLSVDSQRYSVPLAEIGSGVFCERLDELTKGGHTITASIRSSLQSFKERQLCVAAELRILLGEQTHE